jgi:hypothetical protein
MDQALESRSTRSTKLLNRRATAVVGALWFRRVGLSKVQLRSFLGQPDSEQPAADFAQRVPQYWTYTIGSPSPLEAGGGFPELSFHFDDLCKVRGTMCALAK